MYELYGRDGATLSLENSAPNRISKIRRQTQKEFGSIHTQPHTNKDTRIETRMNEHDAFQQHKQTDRHKTKMAMFS